MRLLWGLLTCIFHYCACFHLKFRANIGGRALNAKAQLPFVFGDVSFADPVAQSLRNLGITKPSPIQQTSLVTLNSGASSILHAHTGSGKTIAYLLPILKRIYDTTKVPFKSIVIVPTRELAVQVAADVVSLCGDPSMVHICLDNIVDNIVAPIVVGTPFRLVDALKGRCMNKTRVMEAMQDLEYLVIDEVDRLVPVPGKYVRLEEKEALLAHNNPCIELLRFIVKHKEHQLMTINRGLLAYQWERQLPLQVVAASATVGRPLLRELNKLLYSYQVIPRTSRDQQPELAPPGSRGRLVVIRPDKVEISGTTRGSPKKLRMDQQHDNTDEEEDSKEDEPKLSRSIGVPSTISHVALLKPPVELRDHSVVHMDKDQLNLKYLELLRDYWVYQKSSIRRGMLFVPTLKDVATTVQLLRKWKVREAIDLQRALGLEVHTDVSTADGSSNDEAAATPRCVMDTKELIEKARQSGVGGGRGGIGRENTRELFVAPESAARGLHLQDLDCVMIFQLPATMDQYLHMAGRTGRLSLLPTQDTNGKVKRDRVVTIVDDNEYKRLMSWQTPLGIKIEPVGEENAKLHLSTLG